MTSANTADGRKTLLSVGSTPLMIPVAKPIANPPSVAVRDRSMPPTTTPTRTTIVSRRAKSGPTKGNWTVRMTATVAASRPERKTKPITVARTPSSRAVSKSAAAARMCSPIVVRTSSSASRASATAEMITAAIVILRTSTPAIVVAWLNDAIDVAISPIVSSRMSIRSDRLEHEGDGEGRHQHDRRDWPRSGRKTTRSISIDSTTTTAKHAAMLAATGHDAVKASV